MQYAFAVLRWVLAAPLSVLLVLLAWLLAPGIALLAFATEDAHTREGDLPCWCRWFQTHDAPLDELWRHGLYLKDYTSLARKTSADVRTSALLRWWCRTLWLWRNPAYGWRAGPLGYRRDLAEGLRVWRRGDWELPANSVELYVASRDGSVFTRSAWSIRARWFPLPTLVPNRYVRVNIGWKLVMPGESAMIATHVHPWRRWKKGADA